MISVILLLASLLLFSLGILSTNSNLVAYYALPPHRGSTFVPILLAFSALLLNSLTLLSLKAPQHTPHFTKWSNWGSSILLIGMAVLILAGGQLRNRESGFTLLLIGITLVSAILGAVVNNSVDKYQLGLLSDGEEFDDLRPTEPTFLERLSQYTCTGLSFLSLTLPTFLLHSLLLIAFFLLFSTIVQRSIDSSLIPPGHLYNINPWSFQHLIGGGSSGGGGLGNRFGRNFRIHLDCRGVQLNPTGISNETAVATQLLGTRTVLVESRRGVAGRVDADWVIDMLEGGELNGGGDRDVRVCYWDRPGYVVSFAHLLPRDFEFPFAHLLPRRYGFSENSPTATIPHLVTALTEALSLSGELARVQPPPRFDEDDRLPRMRSGFILVASEYGALTSTLFAARNPTLIHSTLFFSPTTPRVHYSPHPTTIALRFAYFFSDILASWSVEFGLKRTVSLVRKGIATRGRSERTLSSASDGIRGEIARAYLQEEEEYSRGESSVSSRTWSKFGRFYPTTRPSIVVSRRWSEGRTEFGRGKQTEDQWNSEQLEFVERVVGKGLRKWTKEWDDGGDGCIGIGREVCRASLSELIDL